MKSLLLILFSIQNLFAYPCPQSLSSSEKASAILDWLKPLTGTYELKNCFIEITTCNQFEDQDSKGVIAEIYLKDHLGREEYLPIINVEQKNLKIETQLRASAKRFKYFKFDRFFEEELGRTEAYRLELRLDQDFNLRRLDLGTYATRKKLRQRNGNQSRWYNCGE